MYEAKYKQFLPENAARFAEEDEITEGLTPLGEGAGIPLFEKDGTVYVDDKDNHSIVVGPTGCGKTRIMVLLLLISLILCRESAIINDPKGELFRKVAPIAKAFGIKVLVLNLRDPTRSHTWNPLSIIYSHFKSGDKQKATRDINDLCKMLMSTVHSERDLYWEDAAEGGMDQNLILTLNTVPGEEYYHFRNILPLLYQQNEHIIKKILEHVDPSSSVAVGLRSIVDLEANNTKSCIYSVMLAGLNALIKDESLMDVFSGNEIQFQRFAEEPTFCFVIYPDERHSLDFINHLFNTQSYRALCDVCSDRPDDKLPVRVNYVTDEFSNLLALEGFDNRISEARSKNIRFHLFIQSMSQLEDKYKPAVASTIVSNCTNLVAFSSKEKAFLEYLSILSGKVKDHNGVSHDLISSAELQYLKKSANSVQVLIFRQGVRPYIAELPYYDCSSYYQGSGAAELPYLVTDAYITIKPEEWLKKIESGEFYRAFTVSKKPKVIDRAEEEALKKRLCEIRKKIES